MHNVRVLSSDLLGTNEDCSLGDSISDSSEEMLQKGRGKVGIYAVILKNEYLQSSTYFLPKVVTSLVKVTASREKQTSPERILVIF